MTTPSTPSAYTLRRSLAEAADRRLTGTAVSPRDLGATESTTKTYTELPFVVVTAELAAFLRHEPVPAEVAETADDPVFAGERAVRAANAADQTEALTPGEDFLDQLVQGGHVERIPSSTSGDDADDWDVDDGPANDPQALEAAYAAEDAIYRAAADALARGVATRLQAFPYHVHNPFTGTDTWFATFAGALAYASAASATDTLDGDLGVWSAAGWGEYRLFKGGRAHTED